LRDGHLRIERRSERNACWIPALYNLAKAGRLSDKFALIGVDRTDRSHEEFRAYLAEGVRSFVSDTGTGPVTAPFDARAWEFLAAG